MSGLCLACCVSQRPARNRPLVGRNKHAQFRQTPAIGLSLEIVSAGTAQCLVPARKIGSSTEFREEPLTQPSEYRVFHTIGKPTSDGACRSTGHPFPDAFHDNVQQQRLIRSHRHSHRRIEAAGVTYSSPQERRFAFEPLTLGERRFPKAAFWSGRRRIDDRLRMKWSLIRLLRSQLLPEGEGLCAKSQSPAPTPLTFNHQWWRT